MKYLIVLVALVGIALATPKAEKDGPSPKDVAGKLKDLIRKKAAELLPLREILKNDNINIPENVSISDIEKPELFDKTGCLKSLKESIVQCKKSKMGDLEKPTDKDQEEEKKMDKKDIKKKCIKLMMGMKRMAKCIAKKHENLTACPGKVVALLKKLNDKRDVNNDEADKREKMKAACKHFAKTVAIKMKKEQSAV